MLTYRHILFALTATIALGSTAQTLRKEITVQHEVVPEPTEVTKLRFSPQFTLPKLPATMLEYARQGVFTAVDPTISPLGPAAYYDTIYTSPYKGYANLGIAPVYNLGASAGYKFVDNDRTRLNAWLQYNGNAYKGLYHGSPLDGQYQRTNTATVALALHHALSNERYLDMGADYTFSRYSTPANTDSTGRQQIHRANLSALYSANTSTLSYSAGGGIGYFGYSFAPEGMHASRELKVDLLGKIASEISTDQRAGLNLDFNLISTSRHAQAPGHTHALLSLAPFYDLRLSTLELHAGIKAQITINSGKALHIAPDVIATWHPTQYLSIYGKAGGGEWQNTLSSLFDATPYGLGVMAYGNSHLPITVEGGLTVGPFKGLAVELSWLYAAANNWRMPVTTQEGWTVFDQLDMRGYKFHAGISYQYGTRLELRTAYETAPQKAARGYYLWRDRARHTLTADLRFTPVTPLDIFLGWEYRGSRAQISPQGDFSPLGHVSNLNAGALYRITSQWSAFIHGENLLCHRYLLIGGVPAQGITGLIGASYKF